MTIIGSRKVSGSATHYRKLSSRSTIQLNGESNDPFTANRNQKITSRRSAAVVMTLLLGSLMASLLALLVGGPVVAASQKIGDPPEASNMRLVGFNDLQGRSAYQPTIHHQGDRWIAYIGQTGGTDAVPKPVNPLTGQSEFNGTSIVDVTDPAHPVYLRHLPGQEGTIRSRRRTDDARLRRQGPSQRRSKRSVSTPHFWRRGA